MKKILLIYSLLFSFALSAQNKISEEVNKLVAQRTTFTPVSVLAATTDLRGYNVEKVVDNATYATIKAQNVNVIVKNAFPAIEIEIPYHGQSVTLQLYKSDIFRDGFHIDTDKARDIAYEPGVYYRGIVKGDVNSVAAISFFNNELSGVVSSVTLNNLVIGKLDRAGNTTDYIIYSDAEMKILNQFNCAVKEEVIEHDNQHQGEGSREQQTVKCVAMYFEIDHDLYQTNGASTTTTTNWMTSVFNNVQTLFANDGITVGLKSMFIWTTEDPYTGESSTDYLYQFNEVRPVFDGDVGQLVGIDPGGLGGVAVTINGLCSQNNFSYSDVFSSFSEVPTYSWTIQVITHEMGHLLGSRHTHSCTWNGNNTAIDNCGPAAGVDEGQGCLNDPPIIPSPSEKGTIMSYCHLISGVGISFTNGFGPQPSAAIANAVNSGTCLSTDCVNVCINTITSIDITSITNTSASFTWTDVGGGSTWEVSVVPFNSNFPNWVTVNSPSYIKTGLNPNTFYKIRIRPLCGGGLTSIFRQDVFATSADWCNGVTITDTGGAAGDYTDMQDYVRTIIPNVPGKRIRLTFTEFDLETDFDYLFVYNGATTSAPDLSNNGITGNSVPGPFVSTSPDGALTIRFFSDQGVVESGYVAQVTCEDNLATTDFGNTDFTYYPNPTNGKVNIVSKTEMSEIMVYNPEGRLLYNGKVNGLETQVDISAFATGTYFFKLKFDGTTANFKILKN
ncbi:MAG TPA: M12 family metallo-peptidase [Flavobacterium sp.]|jgi:hypothetical protein